MSDNKIKKISKLIEFLEFDLPIDDQMSSIKFLEDHREFTIGAYSVMMDLFNQGNGILNIDNFFEKEKSGSNNISIGGMAKNLFAYYMTLKTVWNAFKFKLQSYREAKRYIPIIGGNDFKINFPFKIDVSAESVELKPDNLEMSRIFNNQPVMFVTLVFQFFKVLDGIPFSRIKKCDGCHKWFISKYLGKKRTTNYCCNKCATRENKKDMRSNPEREEQYDQVKKAQKDRYRKKALGKKP